MVVNERHRQRPGPRPAPVPVRPDSGSALRPSAARLAEMLGPWSGGSGPLYRQLADGLVELLEGGLIETGTTLPPERRLATALSVSRNTVAAAYGELRTMGWAEARQGAGTTITASGYSPVGAHRANAIFATLLRDHPDVIDLTIAVPEAAPIVTEVLANASSFIDPTQLTAGHGYEPRGNLQLRSALAEVLTGNGLPTTEDQLLITTGAQQAISLVIRGMTRPGDPVGVEEMSFPGAFDAMATAGVVPVPIAMTDSGLDPEHLEEVVATTRPRLLYLAPTFNNPTGSLLEGDDRARTANFIADAQVTTVDDLTLAELDFGTPAPPPLSTIRPDAPIISVGSMSKVFWGGLRIGWIRAKPPVIGHLAGLKTADDLGTAAPIQRLACSILEAYDETRQWRNEQLVGSLLATVAALERHLPEWEFAMPRGGPHLWLRLPETDASAFAHRLLRAGVAVVPGPLLSANRSAAADRIRIPYYLPASMLELAVEKMADAWREGS